MSTPDFIEVFPDALAPDACAALIGRFEASGAATAGRTGAGVEPEQKNSRDINISLDAAWRDAEEQLNRAMFRGLLAYARKYPQLLLSPLSFTLVDPADGESRRMRAEDVPRMDDATLGGVLLSALRPGTINLQHYRAGIGGYPAWHCEAAPSDAAGEHLHRLLLWTIYLNEGFDGGETEFLYQERKIVPRTGMLLLAPTAFTHTHRGNRPERRDKYIATSWVLFKRARQMFGDKA
jgi:DNA-binding transcriptional regulator YdaS (Cro superfamily)